MNGDIYKEHYQFEWDHRSHLTSALNVPIAVATVIGGALAVMLQGFNYKSDSSTYFFVGFSSLSAVSIVIAIYFLFRALHGYQYQRVPTPAVLKSYYDGLVQWHESNGSDKPTAEKEFEAYLHQRLAEAVENNATNNKRKSGYLYRTNLTLAIAMVFIGFSSVPFLIKMVDAEDKIYSIRVLQLPAANSTLNKEINPMSSNQEEQRRQTTVQQPVIPTPKPPPPPNEFIKEHTIPPSTTEKIIPERQDK